MEKKLKKKGEEPQSKYLQCLRHDSHKWLVSARSQAKCHTWMPGCMKSIVTKERMLSLAQVSLRLNYNNVTVKNT